VPRRNTSEKGHNQNVLEKLIDANVQIILSKKGIEKNSGEDEPCAKVAVTHAEMTLEKSTGKAKRKHDNHKTIQSEHRKNEEQMKAKQQIETHGEQKH
jgi:hypothetical protein